MHFNNRGCLFMNTYLHIPKLEGSEKERFRIYYNERSVFLFRLTSFVIIAASFAYFYLDYLSAPYSYKLLWEFRVVAMLGFITALFLSYVKKDFFIHNFQLIASLSTLLYNICILLMIYYSRPDEMSYANYYTGLLVILIVNIPLRVRLIPILYNALSIGFLYILIAVFKQDLFHVGIDRLINNLFFLLSVIIAVVVAAYVLEIFIRETFINQNMLKAKNLEVLSQKEEILAQRDELSEQKIHLEKQNKEITDSIHYAKRIQKAVMPYAKLLEGYYENFILFYPRDIVSGDFYWFRKIKEGDRELNFIAVADCTGHGVPGSLVSMLGVSLLNEIVIAKNSYNAAEILDELRTRIKATFHIEGDTERKDGMDIALIIIDNENYSLEFAGAFRPLYICRRKPLKQKDLNADYKIYEHDDDKTVLIEVKPDKMPIGWYIVEKPFRSKTVQLQANDKIYLFTDGYTDQIGGANRRKFSIKSFRKILCDIYEKDMPEQHNILDRTLKEWKSDEKQIDDILVLGIKIP